MQPFEYQDEVLQCLDRTRREGRSKALVVMASGLGKTVTAALDVRSFLLTRPNAKVLYLCHQNDILEQALDTFWAIIGGNKKRYGFYHGLEKSRRAQFIFASFQTMRINFHRFGKQEFDYIIVDESHHTPAQTYRPVVSYFKPKFLLGLTATPDRMDMKDIRIIFGEEIYSLDLAEALARKLVAEIDYWLVTDEIVELGKIDNPCRMTLKQLNHKIFATRRDEEIVKIIREKTADVEHPRTMIFCPSVTHTERLHKLIPGSIPVHSCLSDKEQSKRITAFRSGLMNVILTVDKFNEGLDIPEVNVVIFLRVTQSNTIFYQQLGRGLRKDNGRKKKVLVIDFAANCERLLMVKELADRVREKRKERGAYDKDPLTITGGSFHFSESARNILEILQKMRQGYTKEDLIEYLREEAKILKRSPRVEDIIRSSKSGRTASPIMFYQTFKSWNNALTEAGLPITQRSYSKAELIEQLKAEAKRLDRPPRISDIAIQSKAGLTASPVAFINAFGSWNRARAAANLPTSFLRFTKKEMLQQLRSEAKRLDRTPKLSDLVKAFKEGRVTNPATLKKTFRGLKKARLAAKLLPLKSKRHQKRDLLRQLKSLAKRLGRVPTSDDIRLASKRKEAVAPSTFASYFGSWENTLKAARMKSNQTYYSRKDLIGQYLNERRILGRIPTLNDLMKAHKKKRVASIATFYARFNGLANLRRAAELSKTKYH